MTRLIIACLLVTFSGLVLAAPTDVQQGAEEELLNVLKELELQTKGEDQGSIVLEDKRDDDEDNDPQPIEEVEPQGGNYEGDILLTGEQQEEVKNEEKEDGDKQKREGENENENPLKEYGNEPEDLEDLLQDKRDDDEDNDPQPIEEVEPQGGNYEGDILLTGEQQEEVKNEEKEDGDVSKRGGVSLYGRKWPNNRAYYKFAPGLRQAAKDAFLRAKKDVESSTCFRLVEGESPNGDHIYVFKGQGCFSMLGFTGGKQELSLGQHCETNAVATHELLHAMGVFHEQSRMDRDKYVRILTQNIKSPFASQFRKHQNSDTFGIPYDYKSIMHYGSKYFSKNGKATIQTFPKKVFIGQRWGLSNSDKQFLNKYLGCSGGGGGAGPSPTSAPTPAPASRPCKTYYVMKGSVTFSGTSAGATATVKCPWKFPLQRGSRVRTCQSNGQWSGPKQLCADRNAKPGDILKASYCNYYKKYGMCRNMKSLCSATC